MAWLARAYRDRYTPRPDEPLRKNHCLWLLDDERRGSSAFSRRAAERRRLTCGPIARRYFEAGRNGQKPRVFPASRNARRAAAHGKEEDVERTVAQRRF